MSVLAEWMMLMFHIYSLLPGWDVSCIIKFRGVKNLKTCTHIPLMYLNILEKKSKSKYLPID